jgi:exopolyphosphatase/guanosine-5'-triphosphate,3'-diphosphate pyrophosphatase
MTAMTRVAAIDCGTNSIRLLVADVEAGNLTAVVKRMEIVRLGQGVDRTGRLAPDALERTRAALAEYAAQIKQLGAEAVRMVATSATRDAANADEFRDMAVRTLGAAPEVVSGDEEARLSFDGAVRGMDAPSPYLVTDIGGGSTELVLGSATVEKAVSVNIGCVRMTERHLHGDPPTEAEVAAASHDIGMALDAGLAVVPGALARTLIGVAGSVTTVAALALDLPAYDPDRIHRARIGYSDVARVTADLLASTVAQRLELPVMHPGRADVIGAGALVLRILMERVGAEAVVASEHDILEGIAWSLVDRQ